MRRIGESDSDKQTLRLLKEGAENASQAGVLEKRLAQAEEQIKLLRYALMNVMKTLQSYPLVKSQIEELDYRSLGMLRAISAGEIPSPTVSCDFGAAVEKHAKDVRTESFEELSKADDEQNKLEDAAADAITDAHTVIFTSDCKDYPEAGVFRSKIPVGSAEFKDQKEAFLGKKVGDTFEVKIQGKDHVATIVGLRRKKQDDSSTKL